MMQYAEETLERINKVRHLNYLTYQDPPSIVEGVMKAQKAYKNGEAKPLEGIFIATKDNIDLKGQKTSAGLKAFDVLSKRNSSIWSLFEMYGAINCGRTNMHRMAFGTSGQNEDFGDMLNPYDHERSVGGSSGGSGAIVGSGALPLAFGTDTGGSIRIPASWCGAVGYRPTINYWPADYGVKISHYRDSVGPIASNVEDIVYVNQVINRLP